MLRQAVGKGGSAADDRGIEGLWRRSEAKGAAAATSALRRALLQAFPHLATDLLPYYERRLGIVPAPTATEAERRAAIAPLWTRQPIKSWNELEAKIREIDPRFSLINRPFSEAVVTQAGRAFRPHALGLEPEFGLPAGHTSLPMYSSHEVLRVLFAPGYSGALNTTDSRLVEQARLLLGESMPSWEHFEISTGEWHLGTTPIGQGALA